ncbi:SET domain-containing protein [Ceratobasidium sp. AG-I]|nr:SET domain-containing protein [Ceratobasidium sp. AG-I]
MRAPHPNIRPAVPDSPSLHLSPSKQLAQRKDAVLIEGEELVTWRVDFVNSMPDSYRNSLGSRAAFEAFIEDAVRENEPCAPEITIENEVDHQPCPPWEFIYYNRMVYGTNVPRPNPNALQGCDCLGPCDPTNRNCACVRRQEQYFEENPGLSDFSGFAFKPDGTIKYHNGAVFGCNSKCSCDLECQNKVLQQGRKHAITIKKTKAKGWGMIQTIETIPAGSYIGVYTGELLTEGFAGKRARVYDEFGRTYLLNIDFAHIRSNKDAPTYAVDAFHAGNFTRFFNHSCRPNMFLTAYYCEDADIQKPLITLFCDRLIKAGQELTFSYTGLDVDDPDVSQRHKGKVFGECLCGAEGCFGIMFS